MAPSPGSPAAAVDISMSNLAAKEFQIFYTKILTAIVRILGRFHGGAPLDSVLVVMKGGGVLFGDGVSSPPRAASAKSRAFSGNS